MAKKTIPKNVTVKNGEWYVRRLFPTAERDARGKVVYIPIARKCVPETEERSREVYELIGIEFARVKDGVEHPRVGGWFREFVAVRAGSVARATHELEERILENHIAPYPIAELVMREVGHDDIQRHLSKLSAAGVAAPTARKVHKFLSLGFNHAFRTETVTRIPTRGVYLPRARASAATWFNEDEARAFLRAARALNATVLEFALETGMRPGEYLALRWSDVDLKRRRARVTRSVAVNFKGGGFEIKEPKTKGSRRTVRISEGLASELALHMEAQAIAIRRLEDRVRRPLVLEHMERMGVNYEKRKASRARARESLANFAEYGLVFPGETGKPQSRIGLNNRLLNAVLEAAGLNKPGNSLYTLRHTCATLMLAAGASPVTVAKKLGTSAEMLWKTYAHVLESMETEAEENFTSMIYPATSRPTTKNLKPLPFRTSR